MAKKRSSLDALDLRVLSAVNALMKEMRPLYSGVRRDLERFGNTVFSNLQLTRDLARRVAELEAKLKRR